MNLNRILRTVLLVGIFAIPFIPLVVSTSMFFPFITGKNFLFRIIVEVIFAVWAILAWRDASYRLTKNPLLLAFGAFIAIIAAADFFGENPYRSFWSNYERMEGLVAHIHLFGYFIVATTVLYAEKLWERLFFTSFGVNAAVLIFSTLQLSGKLQINQGGVRVDATFGNATYLAVYLLFNIFLAVYFLMRHSGESETGSWRSVFFLTGLGISAMVVLHNLSAGAVSYTIAIFAVAVLAAPLYFLLRLYEGRIVPCTILSGNLAVLYYTQTRGAILGLIVGALLAVILIALGNWQNRRVRLWALGFLGAFVIFMAIFVIFRDSAFIRERPTLSRFATISLTEQTTKSRFMVWDMSWQGVKERPILGWGQDNFIVVFAKHYKPAMWNQEPWFDRSHNVFFDWMVAGGLLGFLSYLSLFGAAGYVLWRRTSLPFNQKSILSGLLAGYFFQNLFVFDNLTSYIMFFSVLGYISVLGRTESGNSRVLSGQKTLLDEYGYSFLAPAALGLVIFSFYFANWKPIMASRTLIQAISPQSEGYPKNLEYFNKLFALNTFGSGEAREQLIQIGMRIRNADQNSAPLELKQNFFNLTREQMQKQIEMSPTDVRYELYLASFLDSYGMYDEGIAHLNRAIELSPQKQLVLFELASAYINKGQPEKALPYLEQAYNEAPNYADAVLMYAAGLYYAGRDDEGDRFLMSKFGTLLVADIRILSAYDYRKKYDRIIDIREKELEQNPGDQQIELSLAAAYLRAGLRNEAVIILQKMIEENPSFKDQGEYYIREIQAGRNP